LAVDLELLDEPKNLPESAVKPINLLLTTQHCELTPINLTTGEDILLRSDEDSRPLLPRLLVDDSAVNLGGHTMGTGVLSVTSNL
jgi:hypothetical protein